MAESANDKLFRTKVLPIMDKVMKDLRQKQVDEVSKHVNSFSFRIWEPARRTVRDTIAWSAPAKEQATRDMRQRPDFAALCREGIGRVVCYLIPLVYPDNARYFSHVSLRREGRPKHGAFFLALRMGWSIP